MITIKRTVLLLLLLLQFGDIFPVDLDSAVSFFFKLRTNIKINISQFSNIGRYIHNPKPKPQNH